MSSPFPPNAELVFQVPTGSEAIDALGNPSSATEPLVVSAYLREAKGRSKTSDALDGGEMPRIALEGRIDSVVLNGVEFELAALPASILPGAKAVATITDLGGLSPDLSGDFFLEGAIASAFGTSAALGAPIRGYLVSQVAWGDAL